MDLDGFARDLRTTSIPKAVSTTMSRAGGNVMRRAQELAPSGPHLTSKNGAPYSDSISFEKDGDLAVEAFARDRGQGPLAGILEFGHGPNAPHPHFIPALDEEAEALPKWLGEAVSKALS